MKATINLSSGYFNKNQKTIQELYNSYDENEYNQVGTYFMEIGELEKVVNLDEFEKAYWRNDTAQEHPVYYKVYDRDNKFDLKGMKLSPIAMEHSSTYQVVAGKISEGESFNIGRGIKDNGEYYNTQADNIYYDTYGTNTVQNLFPDYYGQRICPTYSSNAYRLALIDTIDTCVGQIKPLQSTFANYFTNADVVGLKAYYDTVREKVIAPANIVRTLSMTTDPVGNNKTVAYASDYTTPLMAFNTLLNYQTRKEQVPDGYINYSYHKMGFFKTMSFMTKDNTWTDDFRWCSFGLNGTDLFYTTSSNSPALKTPPIFLRDKNGDYWMMMLSPIETYATYTSEHKTGGAFTPVISLVNIKDFPYLSYDKNARVASTDVSEYVITALDNDIDFLRQRLDWVFSPKPSSSYGDDGPDAYGPGDPYEDIGNAGDAIGGNSNIVDDLAVNDKTPNTGMSQYMVSGGLYGAYLLDPEDLRKYTGTLDMLYKHSSALVVGPIYEQYANRITKNSTSLIMLPYNVLRNSSDATLQKFIVGNALIANNYATEDDWSTYLNGSNSASALRLTKEWTTETTDLGYLDHYYDNFLDFAPYVTASLYLPYIGTVSLPLNLIQSTSEERKHLTLTWNISNLTGDIVCMLNVNDMSIMYWTGNCARTIPLSIDNNGAFLRECTQQIVGSVLGALK